jgi:hypothetical protein
MIGFSVFFFFSVVVVNPFRLIIMCSPLVLLKNLLCFQDFGWREDDPPAGVFFVFVTGAEGLAVAFESQPAGRGIGYIVSVG